VAKSFTHPIFSIWDLSVMYLSGAVSFTSNTYALTVVLTYKTMFMYNYSFFHECRLLPSHISRKKGRYMTNIQFSK
jgi:hypothetical protein